VEQWLSAPEAERYGRLTSVGSCTILRPDSDKTAPPERTGFTMTLVYLAVAWTAGIALANVTNLPWQVVPVLGLIAFLGLNLWRENAHTRLGALCVLMLALGAGRFLLAVPHFDATSLATYNDAGWVTIEGVVTGEPDEREGFTNLRVEVQRLALPDGTSLAVEGMVLVKADRYPRRRYGDRIQVEGLLETPPVFEGFSYRYHHPQPAKPPRPSRTARPRP